MPAPTPHQNPFASSSSFNLNPIPTTTLITSAVVDSNVIAPTTAISCTSTAGQLMLPLGKPIINGTDDLMRALGQYREVVKIVMGYWEEVTEFTRSLDGELKKIKQLLEIEKAELQAPRAAGPRGWPSRFYLGQPNRGAQVGEVVERVIRPILTQPELLEPVLGFLMAAYQLTETIKYGETDQRPFSYRVCHNLTQREIYTKVIQILSRMSDFEQVRSAICVLTAFSTSAIPTEASKSWHSESPVVRTHYTEKTMQYLGVLDITQLRGIRKDVHFPSCGLWWGLPWESRLSVRDVVGWEKPKWIASWEMKNDDLDSGFSIPLASDLWARLEVKDIETGGHGMFWMT